MRKAASYQEIDSDWDLDDDERPQRGATRSASPATVVKHKVTSSGRQPSAPPIVLDGDGSDNECSRAPPPATVSKRKVTSSGRKPTAPPAVDPAVLEVDRSDDESLAPPRKVPRVRMRLTGPECTRTKLVAAPAADVATLLEGALAAFRAIPRVDAQSLQTAQAALDAEKAHSAQLAHELMGVKRELKDREEAQRKEAASGAADLLAWSAEREGLSAEIARQASVISNAATGDTPTTTQVVDKVSCIMDSVMSKLNAAYTAEYKQLTDAVSASAVSSGASSGVVWCVLLDSGAAHELPMYAQTKIDDAAAQQASPLGRTTIVNAYTQPHPHNAGGTFSYNVHLDVDSHGTLTVTQVNTETMKERTLSRQVPSPAGSAASSAQTVPPPDVCMNSMKVRLEDENGGYIFADELRDILALSGTTYRGIGCTRAASPALIDLAGTFSAPFRGLDFTLGGESESWCRCASFRDFLAYGKEMCDDNSSWPGSGSPACFVWAHGTQAKESINNDYFGLNTVFSSDGSYRGRGVYVAANDYVPSAYSSTHKRHASEYVLGVALTSTVDTFLVDRYRLPIAIRGEPSSWSQASIPNAIYLPNAQVVCAFPFGFVRAP